MRFVLLASSHENTFSHLYWPLLAAPCKVLIQSKRHLVTCSNLRSFWNAATHKLPKSSFPALFFDVPLPPLRGRIRDIQNRCPILESRFSFVTLGLLSNKIVGLTLVRCAKAGEKGLVRIALLPNLSPAIAP